MALEALKQYAQEIMRPTVEDNRTDHGPAAHEAFCQVLFLFMDPI